MELYLWTIANIFHKLKDFIFRPEWTTGIDYSINARVKITPTTDVAQHYRCTQAHKSSSTTKPGGTPTVSLGLIQIGTAIDMGDEFGDNCSVFRPLDRW